MLRSNQLVQLIDLYPMTLSALGLPQPGHAIDGIDLLPVLTDNAPLDRDVVLGGMFGKSLMATDGRWLLHQSPRTENAPLHWHSSRASRFPGVRYELGPFDNGRRAVHGVSSWPEPTWLSALSEDPAGLVNLADRHPEQLATMQQLAGDALGSAQAPAEQWTRLGLASSSA